MRYSVLFLSVLGCTLADPNGYYHQEYNYKTSASSYRNNELQHQTDDQGYYKKDGDLAGKFKPRVDANSEHSEYVNPNTKTGQYHTGFVGGANGDLSSYGNLRAENSYGASDYGSHGIASEGLAQTDNIAGGRYSAGSYGSSYGSSSYGTSSNLHSITDRLQQDLQRELQEAVQENRAYSQTNRIGISELERELRQNLTDKLNAELMSRYGQQSIRGGLSYTISGGRLHSTANYDNQELADLRRQLENSLLNQLRTQYQRYDTSAVSRYENHGIQDNYGYSGTTLRPYYNQPVQTVRPFTTRPIYPNLERIRYTPTPNPESITTIATRVQNQLDSRLNELLQEAQRTYFSSNSAYSLTNTDVVLERLRNELRSNLTYLLDEDIRRNYGSQIERDGHLYSLGPGGETSSQYNYGVRDLENLRSQIERNLLEKLNRDFETHRSRWSQQSKQSYSDSRYGSSNVNYQYSTPHYAVYSPRYEVYSTPRYEDYNTNRYNTYNSDVEHLSTRPTAAHITPLITSGGSNSNQQYKYLAGSKSSGYEVSGSGSSISQLQRQLQQDLSRQLQAAISRGQYGSYSTSGSYNPSSYQVSLQQLSDELNRNLTRQLQEYSSGSYYSTYGNVNQEQLANLRNQLQADLMSQLQQGLQQHYSSSSSYSASSSSSSSNSNYRPVRGSQNYQLGQYRTGGNVGTFQGEDCLGDDPNSYVGHRIKRSQPYRSQPLGLSSSGYYRDYGNTYNTQNSYNPFPRHYSQQIAQHPDDDAELSQHITDPDLTQQIEDQDFQRIELGQQTDESDLTQQVENSHFGKLQSGSQEQQIELGQQTDESDLTQQVENSPFEKLQSGSQRQQIELGQETDDSDLTQQVQSPQYEQIQTGADYTQQNKLGQQLEDFELTQQQEVHSGKIQHTSQHVQEIDNADLTQQVENSQYEQLTNPHYTQQNQLGQQLEDFDLSNQHTDNLGKLQFGSQIQQKPQQKPQLVQEVDNSDLTQQVQNSPYKQLQTNPQYIQQNELNQNLENLDLTQQSDLNFGKIHLGTQNQQQIELGQESDNSDLTQQVENNFGSQNQRQIETGQETQEHTNIPTQEINTYTIPHRGYPNSGKLYLTSPSQIRPIRPIQPNQQVYSDIHQQVEDSRYRNFQSGSQQREPHIQYGGQENLDLTQQVESSGLENLQTGPQEQQQVDLGSPDTTQQVEENVSGKLQFGSQHPRESFQELYRKKQIVAKIRATILEQTESAVKNSYSFVSDNTQLKLIYNTLRNELRQNITKQLDQYRPNANPYSSYFSNQDLKDLREQLENEFKIYLRKKIHDYSNRHISQQTELVDDHDLIQQVEEVDSNLTQQQEVQNTDLTQQNEQNPFKPIINGNQEQTDYTTINHNVNTNSQSQLQFGSQQIQQQPDDQTQDLIQQVEDDDFGKYQSGQQEIEQQSSQHEEFPQYNEDNYLSNANKIDINQQTDNNNFGQTQIPSANLQLLGNRPITRKPVNSNNFLQSEINQQQKDLLDSQQYRLHQQQINVNERPNNLPTLNQVIQQQQLQNNNEYNSDIPSAVEPLRVSKNDDLNQQIDLVQQETDLTDENPTTIIPQQSSGIETIQPHAGQSIIVTNQGQFIPRPQTRLEAENQADLLIQKLRSLQNSPQQSPNEQNLNYPLSSSQINNQEENVNQYNIDQANSNDQQRTNLEVHSNDLQFNQQQLQFAKQLEDDLSKQLQDCLSNNYNTYSGSLQQPYQITYQQLSQELQRNITQKIRENNRQYGTSYSSYSTYGTLSGEQRDKLLNQLQEDLLKQLQQNLRVTYGFQQANTQHSSYGYSRGYSSYGNSQINQPNIHYGQQNELVQSTEETSDIHPVQPQQANVVQSVEPITNYNNGVKGQSYARNVSPLSPNVISTESVQTSNLENQPIQVQDFKQDEVSTADVPVESLPWWKRVGNKIKYGASSLKEKIIG